MGITGCCNKSENENITSSPASFLLIHNFCTVLLREIGVGQSMPYPGRPSQARTVPPASARCRRAATSAAQWRKFEREKRANRKCRVANRLSECIVDDVTNLGKPSRESRHGEEPASFSRVNPNLGSGRIKQNTPSAAAQSARRPKRVLRQELADPRLVPRRPPRLSQALG